MMLEFLGEQVAADRIRAAIAASDLATGGTKEIGASIIAAL